MSGLLINSNCCFDFLVSDPLHLFLICKWRHRCKKTAMILLLDYDMGNSCIEVATIAIDETMILNFKSTIALLVLLKKALYREKMWCRFKVSVMFCLACLLTLIAVLISSFPIRHTYSWYASDDIVAKKPRRYRKIMMKEARRKRGPNSHCLFLFYLFVYSYFILFYFIVFFFTLALNSCLILQNWANYFFFNYSQL